MVAGQRGHQQYSRLLEGGELLAAQVFFEMQQAAKRPRDSNFFDYPDLFAFDQRTVDFKLRLFILLAEAVHQFVTGGDTLRERRMG